MSQVSPPIRILLVCALAFLGAWMLFLRPKDEASGVPPAAAPNVRTEAPAVSTPGKLVEAAQNGVGEPAPADIAAPARPVRASRAHAPAGPDLKGVPGPVARAIEARKAVVILFWDRRSADDRAVRAALERVDRRDGRVYLHAAPIRSISRYGRIARGAEVEQSPTVVVVDRRRRATTVAGYVDATTIDQMVVDALPKRR